MKTAYATIKGFELMRMFKKGQLDMWNSGQDLTGEIRLIERQFGIWYLQRIINQIKGTVPVCTFFATEPFRMFLVALQGRFGWPLSTCRKTCVFRQDRRSVWAAFLSRLGYNVAQ
jgi:hypothetical protein